MRYAETDSWQIRFGSAPVLEVLVWLRDACGLRDLVRPVLPPAEPAVAVAVAVVERWPISAAAWSDLWARALVDPGAVWPDREDESSMDLRGKSAAELRSVLRERVQGIRHWRSSADVERRAELDRVRGTRRTPPPLGHLVRRQEALLGRTARPFRLEVVRLPLTGKGGWVVGEERVLLSNGLAADHEALVGFLSPVVARLA